MRCIRSKMGQETANKVFQIREDKHYNFRLASQLIVLYFKSFFNPSRPNPKQGKINLNFYFHIFCGPSKKSYEGLKDLQKTFSRQHKEV